MIAFWILAAIDAVVAAVAVHFFVRGLRHAAGPRYFAAWLRVFALLLAGPVLGLLLHGTGHTAMAVVMVAIPAAFGLAYAGLVGLMLTPRGRSD